MKKGTCMLIDVEFQETDIWSRKEAVRTFQQKQSARGMYIKHHSKCNIT